LFERAAGPGDPLFQTAIDHLCGGRPDSTTLDLLGDGAKLREVPSSRSREEG